MIFSVGLVLGTFIIKINTNASRAANISKQIRDVSSVATTVCKRLTKASDNRRVQCYNSPLPKGSGGIHDGVAGRQ